MADEHQQRRIAEAAALSTQLSEQGLETSPALEAWLAADPEHRRIWERRTQTWSLLESQKNSPELLALRQRALGDLQRMGSRRWNHGAWKWRATAAAVAVLAVMVTWSWYVVTPHTYRTRAGELRVVTLPDSSRVHLDASTEVRVSYSDNARKLSLLKGQARFEVARDVMRPFSVLAGNRRVVALGTVFNVDLLEQELRVTLIEGKVMVLDQGARADPGRVPARDIELAPGQQLKVAPAGKEEVILADVQRAIAWESGKLVFDDEPLAQIVTRVSRYSQQPVTVADAHTGALRMSGVFEAGDVTTFVETVKDYLDVEIEQRDGGFLLKRSQ
ncbi:FecR family protein [Steroidobacter sp.]|uniref:FecR family protein n=1 Tax=Steroidobacter sp. TaxID=1978227 RepID=UPI0025D762F2|nr:FecR domain-containing protein [Steroidobacter sp.]